VSPNTIQAMRRDLPSTPVHQALVRPILLAGVERELAVMEMLAGMFLVAVAGPSAAAGLGMLLLVAIHFALLVPVSKHDPQMLQVYLRHVTYRPHYPAASPLGSLGARVPPGR
jgi:type IV secretion system protein TrbD